MHLRVRVSGGGADKPFRTPERGPRGIDEVVRVRRRATPRRTVEGRSALNASALRWAVAASATVVLTAVTAVAMAGTTAVNTQALAVAAEAQQARARAAAKEPGLAPGTFRGQAFDACAAPTSAQMKAWSASPYRATIIYFGGIARGCRQPNLTASWVSTQRAAGWDLIPIYVGPQAPCTESKTRHKLSLTAPAADGRTAAADAVAQARGLGLEPDSVLIYDMESYAGDAACERAVLSFLSAWTATLHDLGYLSGVYGDMSATIADVVAAYGTEGFVPPDYVDFARWDGNAVLTDVVIPDTLWPGQRRMKQYRGPHKETWGGVTITIDSNIVDWSPAPQTPIGDFTGNGWSDLLTITPAGALDLHTGNGATLTARRLGTGWAGMDAVVRPGDFTGDGREDLIAREAATGLLWLYPGTGTGVAARVNLGRGWGRLREITAVADLDRDRRPDLVAADATGRLLMFPGRQTSLGAAVPLGDADWSGMDELAGVGDVDRDGVGDLVARVADTGELRLYGGWGRTMSTFRVLQPAGGGLSGLVGAGDFDRDGRPDLMAVDTVTGALLRCPVRLDGLGDPVTVRSGMAGLRLL